MTSYPSLWNWKVSEGVIDGESSAVDAYLAEVKSDPTFPTQLVLDNLNKQFNKQLLRKQYQEQVRLAQDRGYEWPEKPEG